MFLDDCAHRRVVPKRLSRFAGMKWYEACLVPVGWLVKETVDFVCALKQWFCIGLLLLFACCGGASWMQEVEDKWMEDK